MKRIIVQQIHKCAHCEITPADGEFLVNIGAAIWCQDCADEAYHETEEQKHRRVKKLDL